MKELMIHEVTEDTFKHNLQDYTLTFDDGLYSQYYYWERLNLIPTKKILFICCDLISIGPIRRCGSNDITCFEAMKTYNETGEKVNYMTLPELEEMDNNFIIGAHSYYHRDIEDMRLKELADWIKFDTERMLVWFNTYLHITPVHYCFPFNYEHPVARPILKEFGFKYFHGGERVDILTL